MNIIKIQGLLDEWKEALMVGRERAEENISAFELGPNTRVKKTDDVTVFDFKTADDQYLIQQQLCSELPLLSHLITSKPAIEGYQWRAGDYIDLYFDHYQLVVEKSEEAITATNG